MGCVVTCMRGCGRGQVPPSKVLHVRNLPWECTSEELTELCSQFGKVMQTKMGVGANKNQAFVEMVRASVCSLFFPLLHR
jgi:RNA recognition motif-containing protein